MEKSSKEWKYRRQKRHEGSNEGCWGGIGGLILLIVIVLLGGGDPGMIFNDGINSNTEVNNPGSPSYYKGTTPISEEERQLADFVSIVLADTEDTWNEIFASASLDY